LLLVAVVALVLQVVVQVVVELEVYFKELLVLRPIQHIR
jgi:hypothetical protein